MSEATTTHNPDRVIAYSLVGPVYAPVYWSDEQVAKFRERYVSSCAPIQPFHQGGYLGSSGRSIEAHPRSEWVDPHSRAAAEYHWPTEPLSASRASRCCARRPLVKLLQTTRLRKNFSHRISMVVVAIAMVVGLRGLVNLLSQYTRTDGGAV